MTADHSERPSKTRQKQEMHALQELGEELAALSPERLARLPLSEELHEAIRMAQGMGRNEARRRQMQYVGKLMRSVDPEPLRAAIATVKGESAAEVARLHRREQLRTRLLADEAVLADIARDHPGADLQHLRSLRRAALKEQQQGKPPRSYRAIFQFLKELENAPTPDEASNEHEH